MRWFVQFLTVSMITVAFLYFSTAGNAPVANDSFLIKLHNTYEEWTSTLPQERIYLQCDKSLYKPGEDIWFTSYVRQGSDFADPAKSDILHVELINPRGNVMKQHKLILKNGTAKGDFSLDASLPGGLYKLKAYTEWQKNQEHPAFFEKELQVQDVVLPRLKMTMDFQKEAYGPGEKVIAETTFETNDNKPLANKEVSYKLAIDGREAATGQATTDKDGNVYLQDKLPANLNTTDGLLTAKVDYEGQTESISRSIPIVLNKVRVQFFPEGGHLVDGLKTNIAFRAVDENSEPADISGEVHNSNGEVVASFSSFHDGMGAFELMPNQDEEYTVHLTKPAGIDTTYALPEILPKGYVLNAERDTNGNVELVVRSSEKEELFLVGTSREQICYQKTIRLDSQTTKLTIPKTNFPFGVARFTLFDSQGIERAERLLFLNRAQQLNIDIQTDKERYLPREKVNMTIRVRDDRGVPVPGTFSMAVVDDQLLRFADDHSGQMLYHMAVAPEIKGDVHEPSYYFDPDNVKAPQALDYVLMTAGWRRFSWAKMRNKEPKVTHQAEQSIVQGKVWKGHTKQALANTTVKVRESDRQVVTDDEGRFSFRHLDLTEPKTLVVEKDSYRNATVHVNEYKQNVTIRVYPERGQMIERMGGVEDRAAQNAAQPGAARRKAARPLQQAKADQAMARKDAKRDIDQEAGLKVAQAGEQMPEDNELQEAEEEIVDKRANLLAEKKAKEPGQGSGYYRARDFPAPVYEDESIPEQRTDFRSTVYWNGQIKVDRTGKTTISFYNGDRISSFRATVEGIGANGQLGHTEATYHTQLPLSIRTKLPKALIEGDEISLPLTLKNNTSSPLEGKLKTEIPEGLTPTEPLPERFSLASDTTSTLYLPLKVTGSNQDSELSVTATSGGLSDGLSKTLALQPQGFPVKRSFSGQEEEASYSFQINNLVNGSLTAKVTAYPTVMNELLSGVEAILQEPHGCFEQTSASSYPNLLAMAYMQEVDQEDPELMARASNLLDKGYNKLVTYETKEKGYEWFGREPAHEALTAYGLMQFNDMKGVYEDVSQSMINRTAEWLLSRKNGKGGFEQNDKALDSYGRADEDITNGYIVYALSEAGYNNIAQEVAYAYDQAMKTEDPYLLALMGNALLKRNDKRAKKVLGKLTQGQNEDGSWQGAKHSITHSTGRNLRIETTSLALLALLKADDQDVQSIKKAVEYLMGQRSGHGNFGSTQATIMALKSLTEYAKYAKRTSESGTLEVFVDGAKVGSHHYQAGETEPLVIDGLASELDEGRHTISIHYKGVENPLPYTVAVDYHTTQPTSSPDTKVDLTTTLSKTDVEVGETVRLTTELANTTQEGLPMTMAIVGIPAGLSAQPWQLKELQEQNKVDFYEVTGNNVVLYYRQMKPSQSRIINLDLKAEVPGTFDAPASSAYLYYSDDHKVWTATGQVQVSR